MNPELPQSTLYDQGEKPDHLWNLERSIVAYNSQALRVIGNEEGEVISSEIHWGSSMPRDSPRVSGWYVIETISDLGEVRYRLGVDHENILNISSLANSERNFNNTVEESLVGIRRDFGPYKISDVTSESKVTISLLVEERAVIRFNMVNRVQFRVTYETRTF